ncbi:hypothetical protein J4467_01795 [Candidatus Woesearchaeota archaeon]|nr:hypothetical protein [Candidatus Woesearchaeota archaeon]
MKDEISQFLSERRYNDDSGELCNLLELGEYSTGPLGFIFTSLLWYGVMASGIYYSNEKSLGGLEVKVESNEK